MAGPRGGAPPCSPMPTHLDDRVGERAWPFAGRLSRGGNLTRRGETPPLHDDIAASGPWAAVSLDLLLGHMLAKELSYQLGDLVAIRFQGEVAGVEQTVFQRLQVALVSLGPGGREDLVVLPPGDQHRRLVLAEVLLPRRVQRRIAAVAEEQVELDLPIAYVIEDLESRFISANRAAQRIL